jgi:hypothetical protein
MVIANAVLSKRIEGVELEGSSMPALELHLRKDYQGRFAPAIVGARNCMLVD